MPEILNTNTTPENLLPPGAPVVTAPETSPAARESESVAPPPTPSITELRAHLDEYAAGLADRHANNENPENLRLDARILIENDRMATLRAGGYSADELEALFTAIHHVDTSIQGRPFGWKYIEAADPSALSELSKRPDTILDTMITHAVETGEWQNNDVVYQDVVKAAELATAGRVGTIGQWREKGAVAATSLSIEKLASDPRLPETYATIASERIEKDKTLDAAGKMIELRKVEKALLGEVLGLSQAVADDIRLAIEGRTMRRDKDGQIMPLDAGGGIDIPNWSQVMRQMSEARQRLGTEGLQSLYENCGIVNFDRYSMKQLERMQALLQRDPDLIGHLQKNDVRIVLTDAFGDHNSAFSPPVMNDLDTDLGTALFFELRRPGDLYRHPVMLKNRLGVVPSSTILGLHGNFGFMAVTTPGTTYQLVSAAEKDEKGKRMYSSELSISESRVAQLFGKYMRPSRKTGEREVILLSCLQASRQEDIVPTAEQLAYQSDPADKVAVYASSTKTNIRRRGQIAMFGRGDLEFIDANGTADPPAAPATVYRVKHPNALQRRVLRKTTKFVTSETVNTLGRAA